MVSASQNLEIQNRGPETGRPNGPFRALISRFFDSDQKVLPLTSGNRALLFLKMKVREELGLGGCGCSAGRTGLQSNSLFIREITGNFLHLT